MSQHPVTLAIGIAGVPLSVLVAVGHVIPSVMGSLASILGVAWYLTQLHESKAVQDWVAKRKANADQTRPSAGPDVP